MRRLAPVLAAVWRHATVVGGALAVAPGLVLLLTVGTVAQAWTSTAGLAEIAHEGRQIDDLARAWGASADRPEQAARLLAARDRLQTASAGLDGQVVVRLTGLAPLLRAAVDRVDERSALLATSAGDSTPAADLPEAVTRLVDLTAVVAVAVQVLAWTAGLGGGTVTLVLTLATFAILAASRVLDRRARNESKMIHTLEHEQTPCARARSGSARWC
jgi:hypothetical protein